MDCYRQGFARRMRLFVGWEWSLLGFPRTTTDLWDQKINTEWCVLVFEICLQFGDLFPQHIRGVANAANDSQSTGIGDGCSESRSSRDVHACEHDWVIDFEEVSDRGAELLCGYTTSDCFCSGLRGKKTYEEMP